MWCRRISKAPRVPLFLSKFQSSCNVRSKTSRTLCLHRQGRILFSQTTASRNVSFTTSVNNDQEDRWYRTSLAALLTLASISFTSLLLWKKTSVKCEEPAENGEEEDASELQEPDLSGLPDIPSHVKYLIIGGGTTAINGVAGIWNGGDLTAQILIVSEEEFLPYERPPLSREFWYDEFEYYREFKYPTWRNIIYGEQPKSVFHMPSKFYCSPKELPVKKKGGVAVITGHKVVRLDVHAKKAFLNNGSEIMYDKCLIATGGKPKTLEVFEKAEEAVRKRTSVFRTLEDFHRLMVLSKKSSSVAVIGGGVLASELACGLGNQGQKTALKVYQIFPESGNLGDILPEYLSELASSVVKKEGVNVIPQQTVVSAMFVNNQVQLVLRDGSYIRVDHVVVATGLESDTDLARSSGLQVDTEHGGYTVNSRLQAGEDIDVWVAGGAACYPDIKLGRRCIHQHHHSILSGRLAGENMAGNTASYKQLPKLSTDLGMDLGLEAVGRTDSSLATTTIFAKTSDNSSKSSADTSKSNTTDTSKEDADSSKQYGRAVVFYKQDNVVVGILLWNVFDGVDYAKRLIMMDASDDCKLQEAAKMFSIH